MQRQQNDSKQKPWIDSTRNSKVYKYMSVSFKLAKGGKMKMTDSTISTKNSHGYYDRTISYKSKGRLFWEKTIGRNEKGRMLCYQQTYYQKKKKSRTSAYLSEQAAVGYFRKRGFVGEAMGGITHIGFLAKTF